MRRRTTAAAGVLVAASLSVAGSGTAGAADRDCGDFASQAEAQAAFLAVPGDPERLDADDDGTACEDFVYPAVPVAAPAPAQVTTQPVGGIAAGDGSAADGDGSLAPYALGGLAFAGAVGAAVAARRSSRTAA
jgi:hypothetical protein